MSDKLTPWFTDGQQPARPGVYNVSCLKTEHSRHWYARWDGWVWYMANTDIQRASEEVNVCPYKWHIVGSWRGRTKP